MLSTYKNKQNIIDNNDDENNEYDEPIETETVDNDLIYENFMIWARILK